MTSAFGVEHISKMSPKDAIKLQNIGSHALLTGDKTKLNRVMKLERGHIKRISTPKRVVSKSKKKDHTGFDSALTAGGVTTAGVGAVAGGVPGTRPSSDALDSIHASGVRGKAPALKAVHGGVFGYRTAAHEGANKRFKAEEAKHASADVSRVNAFYRGRGAGKIVPEDVIIRHMKHGRKAGAAALALGTATAVYGAGRTHGKKTLKKNQRQVDKYNGTLLGAGAASAGVAHGGSKFAGSQQRLWEGKMKHSLGEADKIVPNLKGASDDDVKNNKKILAGKSKKQAEEAGRLRGHATQERYFARVYGTHARQFARARTPALAVAGVGAGGLIASRRKK